MTERSHWGWSLGDIDDEWAGLAAETDHWLDADDHVGKGPRGWRRSDERVRDDVCHEMQLNSELDPSDVEVTCEDGEILLTGTVRTHRQKRLAEWIADSTYGVRDVHNRLRVQHPEARTPTRERPTPVGVPS